MITTCTRSLLVGSSGAVGGGQPTVSPMRPPRLAGRRRATGRPYASCVSKLTTAVKRILVGRPFRSERLTHTLLPKRIALPVFASDPMSSVAYAPEEILLVLSVAGLTGYAYSTWVGVAVGGVVIALGAAYPPKRHGQPS